MSANINKPDGHPNRERKGSGPVGRLPIGVAYPRRKGRGTPFHDRARVQRALNTPRGPFPHPTKRGPGRC